MSNSPAAYRINHEGLILDIALLETDSLLIHEEIIPSRLKKLKATIEADGVQSAPIIVDRNTRVVLDGMHRTAIMKELSCRFTCACLLDYFDPSIRVQRWCRIIPAPFSEGDAEKLLSELNLRLEPYELVESPADDGSLLLIFKDNVYKIITDGDELVDVFIKGYQLERGLQDWGYHVQHCTESEAKEHLTNGSYEASLFLPKLEKNQVLDMAQENKVFSPKATRHQLPARPVGVNVPLRMLRDKKSSLAEANRKLADHLKQRKITRYDPGSKWMGRTYDEVLYVFSDP